MQQQKLDEMEKALLDGVVRKFSNI